MLKRPLQAFGLLFLTACQAPQVASVFQNTPNRAQIFAQSQSQSQDWFSQLPAQLQPYYAEARGKTGRELFDSLQMIVSRNNHFDSYSGAKGYVYAVAENGPWGPNGREGVIAAYSNFFVAGSGGNGGSYKEPGDANSDGKSSDFINCEHTWPQSFFNKSEPQRADMHHLYPTFSVPNNRRGHLPFGTADEGRVIYQTNNGSKLVETGNFSYSTMPNLLPLNIDSEEIDASNIQGVFEPANTQKGNTARATLYFYLRWQKTNIRSGDYDARNYWSNRVPLFRSWAENLDPVDEREQRRNELIFKKQGNRNPFIDIPNLTSIIGVDVLQGMES